MTARDDFTGSGLKDTSIFLIHTSKSQSRVLPRHAPAPLAEALI
jgi:threonine synthase